MRFNLFILASALFLSITHNSYSQENKRPKIGVVLSGGGAKGIAHIGILKAMEDEGLRPDFIVGTSMGSIIGGLYAIGYSANQLDSIIRQIDWDLVLSNNIPFNYISFEEKEYYDRFLVSLSFEKGKFSLPSGIIEGQMLDQVLNHYTWPAKNYDNFDEFPIPFRCIATDVSTGKEIIYKDGPLSEALRASMAIPSVFTAADLDTTLAVDGGVLNNFPVDQVLKMGADIVIGVNVSSEGPDKAEKLNNMMSILMQIAMFPSLNKIKKDIKECDIYIKPNLENYSTGSFSSYNDILRLGYAAGDSIKPELHKLAQSLNIQNPPPSGTSLSAAPIYIESIELKGNKLVTDKLIYAKLGINPGEMVTRKDIESGINKIFGINAFKKVSYNLDKIQNKNKYSLTVLMKEDAAASLKASVHYDNLFSAGIILNTTLRNLVGNSSRMIVEGHISSSPKLNLNYLKYLGKKQRYAGQIIYKFNKEDVPEYKAGKLTDIGSSTYHEFMGGLLLTQSLKHGVYVGADFRSGKEKYKFWSNFPEGIKHLKIRQFRSDLAYSYNTLNNRNYPVIGRDFKLSYQVFFDNRYSIRYQDGVDTVYINDNYGNTTGMSENMFNEYVVKPLEPNIYSKTQLNYSEFFPIKNNFQFVPVFSAGTIFAIAEKGLFDEFRIGGLQMVESDDVQFLGLNYSEIKDANYIMGGAYLQNIFFKNLYFKYGINYLLHHKYFAWNDLSNITFDKDNNSLFGYGIKITYRSILGPMSLGISSNTHDNILRWYVSIGYSLNYRD